MAILMLLVPSWFCVMPTGGSRKIHRLQINVVSLYCTGKGYHTNIGVPSKGRKVIRRFNGSGAYSKLI